MIEHLKGNERLDVSEYDLLWPEDGTGYKRRLSINSPLLSRLQLRHFLLFNVLPILGTVGTLVFSYYHGITLLDVVLFVGMWLITGLGISAGYHRLLCHQAYRAKRSLRVLLIVFGSMAGQGPALSWVAMHRRHHHIADQVGDIHSPNLHGDSFWGKVRGFFHSHFTWMICHEYPNVIHYVPDLLAERAIARTSRLYFHWIMLGLLLPALIGGIVGGSWTAALSGFLWGGVVRLFVVGQSISALNSVLHLVGEKRYRGMGPSDNSRNSWLLGLLVWGEGWHNNHHAFPYSASFALAWYKVDISYWFIKACEGLGLAWDVKTPTQDRKAFRLIDHRAGSH